jgi:hypothetical protein
MSMAIGDASDFYRLRVIRVDESDVPDLDWRDDILYRRPPADGSAEYDVFRVEAVNVDDEERGSIIGRFATAEEARVWLITAEEDLAAMTKSEFERTYFVDTSGEEGPSGPGAGTQKADIT